MKRNWQDSFGGTSQGYNFDNRESKFTRKGMNFDYKSSIVDQGFRFDMKSKGIFVPTDLTMNRTLVNHDLFGDNRNYIDFMNPGSMIFNNRLPFDYTELNQTECFNLDFCSQQILNQKNSLEHILHKKKMLDEYGFFITEYEYELFHKGKFDDYIKDNKDKEELKKKKELLNDYNDTSYLLANSSLWEETVVFEGVGTHTTVDYDSLRYENKKEFINTVSYHHFEQENTKTLSVSKRCKLIKIKNPFSFREENQGGVKGIDPYVQESVYINVKPKVISTTYNNKTYDAITMEMSMFSTYDYLGPTEYHDLNLKFGDKEETVRCKELNIYLGKFHQLIDGYDDNSGYTPLAKKSSEYDYNGLKVKKDTAYMGLDKSEYSNCMHKISDAGYIILYLGY